MNPFHDGGTLSVTRYNVEICNREEEAGERRGGTDEERKWGGDEEGEGKL